MGWCRSRPVYGVDFDSSRLCRLGETLSGVFTQYGRAVCALSPYIWMISSFVVLHERFTALEFIATGLVFAGLTSIVFGSKISEFIRLKAIAMTQKFCRDM